MRQGEPSERADKSGAGLQQRDDFLAEDRRAESSGSGPAVVEPASPAPHQEVDDDELLADLLGAARRAANGLSPDHPWKIGARGIALRLSSTLDRRDQPPLHLVRQPSRRDDR